MKPMNDPCLDSDLADTLAIAVVTLALLAAAMTLLAALIWGAL